MLTAYIRAAHRRSRCEWPPDDGAYYCDIPDVPGVWATGQTETDAQTDLQDALERWIALGLTLKHPFPALDGAEIRVLAVG